MAGPKLWNNLLNSIRTIDNLDSFKAKCKTHLLNKAFNLLHFYHYLIIITHYIIKALSHVIHYMQNL